MNEQTPGWRRSRDEGNRFWPWAAEGVEQALKFLMSEVPMRARPRGYLTHLVSASQHTCYRVQGLGFGVYGLGFRAEGLGLRVQGLRFGS